MKINRRAFIVKGAALTGATAYTSRLAALGSGAESAPLPAGKFDLQNQASRAGSPPPPPPRSPSGAFDIGDRAELFVDKTLVAHSDGIAFQLHPGKKHDRNPLIRADRPWEDWRVNHFGTAMYDEQERRFKIWYIGDHCESFPDLATFYATSSDGLAWEKTNLGIIKSQLGADTNAVIEHCLTANIYQDLAEIDPARRYKCIQLDYRFRLGKVGGAHALISPDGLRWTRVSDERIFASADGLSAFWDRNRKRWTAFAMKKVMVRGILRRCYAMTTSPDMFKWSESRIVLVPDLRDDALALAKIESARSLLDVPDDPAQVRSEFYGNGFYQAESCLLGFHWVISINNFARYGNHEGPDEIQLGVSRDGDTWDRPFRQPVLAPSPAGGWDCGFLTTGCQAFRFGDEIRLYYSGANYTHGTPAIYRAEGTGRGTRYKNQIGLASWKLDRFVSANASGDGGVLTTAPVHFKGSRLELNLDSQPGTVTVELLDLGERPIAGFAPSDPIATDSLRQVVTWKGRPDVSSLVGRPIVLRFRMKNARLFSYAFRG